MRPSMSLRLRPTVGVVLNRGTKHLQECAIETLYLTVTLRVKGTSGISGRR